MRGALILSLLVMPLLVALNTHDISGLSSSLWNTNADKLPRENWSFRLQTFEGFPFIFESSNVSICFEAGEEKVSISYYNHSLPISPAGSLSCCFVTQDEQRKYFSPIVSIEKIVLVPSKDKTNKIASHFDVREPAGIFKDFYCSALIDDADALSARRTHHPSLADLSNLLSIGFKLEPDPI